ncbi:terminase TerL endonuclease subunit [Limosilactobacillus antri]|uniref:terminase TerL endonuclease subunit n=1 Tax=Limosilactobacillus antri TaxID=227943 RepID=UPI001F55E928|nr:terminase TerL endonuclease subunit [Limosilactobacillus antri]
MKRYDFTNGRMSILAAYKDERDAGNYNAVMKKYRDPATKYAFQILEGDVLSSRAMKLDAFRHLQDLRRQNEDSHFKYRYDLKKAQLICNFAAICPNPDSGKPTPLDVWQLAILCKIVGWVDKDDSDSPRFSDVIISVARTNGKTYLATILTCFYFIIGIDGLHNQDLAYVAITASQTDKGWRYIMGALRMLENKPGFKKLFGRRAIHVVSDKVSDNAENRLLKMSEQSGVFDSYHFKFCVSDEAGSNEMPVQRIKDNKSKITTGMTQTSGQLVQISTAYPDSNSYLYSDEQLDIKMMEQDFNREMDDHLLMLWTQDSLKEAEDPETWSKSNPLLTLNKQKHDTMLKNLISAQSSAKEAGTLAEFENKSLNIWLEAKVNSYLELDDIEAAAVNEPPVDITDRDVFIGFDLSHFSDDTAVAFVIPYVGENDGRNKFYVYEHSFVPLSHSQNSINIKSAKDGIDYRLAEKRGYATIADNAYGYVNEDTIYNYVINFVTSNNLNVKFFCYDPWQADNIIQRFVELTDWPAMPVRQGTLSLNTPTSYFRKLMHTNQIAYDSADIIIKYSFKNAILLTDNHGIKVDKDKATSKIDVVDAIIDAMFRAQYYFDGLDPDKKENKSNPFAGWTDEKKHDYFKNYQF